MGWFKKPLGISSNLEVRKKNKNIKIASTQFGVSCSCFSFFWGRKMEKITMIYSDLQYSTSQLAVEWNLGKSQGPTNKMAGVAVERNPWPRPCSTTSRGWISQVVRWKKGIIFSFQKWNEMMIWRQSMWWININYRNDMIGLEIDFFCDVLGKLIKQTLLDTINWRTFPSTSGGWNGAISAVPTTSVLNHAVFGVGCKVANGVVIRRRKVFPCHHAEPSVSTPAGKSRGSDLSLNCRFLSLWWAFWWLK